MAAIRCSIPCAVVVHVTAGFGFAEAMSARRGGHSDMGARSDDR